MMFAVDVCSLPTTGGATGVAVAAVFLLVLGVVVARWARASAGRVSIVAVVPLLLLGIASVSMRPSSSTCNASPSTTAPPVTAPPTTLAPLSQNLILEIDTSLLPPVQRASLSALDAGFVYELGLFGDVDVHVDWGDGSSDDVTDAGPFAHTYAESGQYTITVSGSLTGFGQSPYNNSLVGAEYLVGVSSFGDLGLTSLDFAFWSANNLVSVPSVLPSSVVSLEDTFWAATLFNDDISGWDTANVTNMTWMFEEAASFNGDISGWDTSSVTNMSWMFSDASAFNQSLNSWDTSSVTDMSGMFDHASVFNQSLNSWDTSSVTDMSGMFEYASVFNQPLNLWNTSNVTNMSHMFDVSCECPSNSSFNQSLSSWNVSLVTDMSNMFDGASLFNQSLSSWVTSKVTTMYLMFAGATSFDQNLGAWDVGEVADMSGMLSGTALSVANYDATLIGWAGQPTRQSFVGVGASGLSYGSLGANARQLLTCNSSWLFSGDYPLLESTSVDSDQIVAAGC